MVDFMVEQSKRFFFEKKARIPGKQKTLSNSVPAPEKGVIGAQVFIASFFRKRNACFPQNQPLRL
jgi:hypothetical protein